LELSPKVEDEARTKIPGGGGAGKPTPEELSSRKKYKD
jgi:hypothetical protein